MANNTELLLDIPLHGPLGKQRAPRSVKRKVNLLLFLTEKIGPEVLPYLLQNPDLNLRVVSESQRHSFKNYMDDGINLDNVQWYQNSPEDTYRNQEQLQGHQLSRWADLLFIVMDASMTSLMLTGYTSDVILHVLRCWDTSKRIVMLPELSIDQWKHPLWKKQLSKVQRRWDWVNVLQPALWDYADDTISDFAAAAGSELIWDWEGPGEIFEAIHSEAQSVLRLARNLSLDESQPLTPAQSPSSKPKLPVEIWTNILDHLGDWELATALGIYTHLPVPYEWSSLIPSRSRPRPSLEYTILTQPMHAIRAFFQSSHPNQQQSTLSQLATKLIFKFSLTSLLTYLALHQKDIFWTSFGLALLPHKASLIYNSPGILSWWLACPAVIKKEYGPEALDGASRSGFIEVLDWWLDSGLQMWYTEKAFESASAKGHIEVLEWWRKAHLLREEQIRDYGPTSVQALPIKVGKSILAAAQSGRVEAIRWWDESGIPYAHEDGVARLASTYGHVDALELWRSLKGTKMIFDNQVLVGATKNGHAAVLEWWRQAVARWGLVVEYKTCDIEEAMEDAVGGGGEGEVREWWARHGLNLGVGPTEWMEVKTL